jgi:hypothetical protein
MATGKRIPYRNSPLTRILAQNFEHDSIVRMLATCWISGEHVNVETRKAINTLNYAKLLSTL